LSSGHLENLAAVRCEVEIIEGDILDRECLHRVMQGVDAVSHQAAQLEIFKGINAPEDDLAVNTIGTLNVLQACAANGVGKLLNASSACVYGQAVAELQSEDHPQDPNWEYGVSKLAAEKYGQIYAQAHGVGVVSLRYAITYGPREWYRRVLTLFIKRVLMNQPPVIFGEGDAVRDFIYVEDVVRLHNLALESDHANGQVFNAGTGIGTSVQELAQLVIKASGLDLSLQVEDLREGEFSTLIPDKRRNASELKRMVLDASKAERELGWQPQTALIEGIGREMEWARQHLARWERVYSTQW
jgi:UDP-glucose 4-epimerase